MHPFSCSTLPFEKNLHPFSRSTDPFRTACLAVSYPFACRAFGRSNRYRKERFCMRGHILLVSIHPTLQDILQFCSFTSITCVYFMLLYVGEYGLVLLVFFFSSLFQFSSECFTFCNLWSFSTLLGIFSIFEFVLVDLFNIFLSLPGNLLCFVSPFKPYMVQIFVKDWHGKTHVFRLLQTATVSDLKKQILVKFKFSVSEYWLSGPGGKKMANQDKLVDPTTVYIRGKLLGGINKCCIKGCTEDAVSQRRLQCMAGVYELKIAPENLCQANDVPLFVCNHHYHLQKRRGHKPKRLYSSVLHAPKTSLKTKEKTVVDDCVSMLSVKTCTSCKKEIVLTKTTPCSKHILKISSKYYMCAYNCFDQISDGNSQEINSDMYDCFSDTEDHSAKKGLGQNYICTECSPKYLNTIKIEKTGLGRQSKNENTQAIGAQSSAETPHITFPFSEFFSSPACNSSKSRFLDYEVISNMFLLRSKTQFSPWKVYLQHGKTGVMLHIYLESSSETLPTKKLTMFCPFLFGGPYQVSFSVYALGKQVDSGILPNDYLNKLSNLLATLFSLQLCLSIYDEKLLKAIKMRKPIDDSRSDCDKTYQIDTKFVLSNRFGKQISETIRSINPQRPCKRLLDLSHSHAQRCQNCTILLQNTNLFHEQHIPSDKCSTDSHTALTKLSFAELLERCKNLKKSCYYWKSRTKYYMKSKKIKPPVNFKICSTELGKLIDKAVEDNLLTQNSILYLLLLDTVMGLQKQEKEFMKSSKMTINKKKTKSQRNEVSSFGY